MLCQREQSDPPFLLHFCNVHNKNTIWTKFQHLFKNLIFFNEIMLKEPIPVHLIDAQPAYNVRVQ